MKLYHVFDFSREAGGSYYQGIFEQRSEFSDKRAGSFYSLYAEEIENVLYNADWEETNDISVGEGKKAYKCYVGGYFGMIESESLLGDIEVVMTDPKGTGYASATLYNHNFSCEYVDFTYAIVSLNDDGTEFLLTVFPGYDIPPQEVLTDQLSNGDVVTVNEVRNFGVRYIKLG